MNVLCWKSGWGKDSGRAAGSGRKTVFFKEGIFAPFLLKSDYGDGEVMLLNINHKTFIIERHFGPHDFG